MSNTDAFALQNSGFNAFLFAEVGTELNGSTLTMLSVLARLGQDPWDQAARWAKLPKAAIIDRLTQSIGQMPLCPQALIDARATASRLILLLPGQTQSSQATERPTGAKAAISAMPRWAPIAFFCGAIALGMAVNAFLTAPAAPTIEAPTAQTVNPPAPGAPVISPMAPGTQVISPMAPTAPTTDSAGTQ
jgi:hypothetical protein